MKHILQHVLDGNTVWAADAETLMHWLMSGDATDAQIAGLLVALRARGETAEELLGFARGMLGRAVSVPVDDPLALDIVGTGGDGLNTINISTVSAIVVAAAGVTVAKHGNRSSSGLGGSADLLEDLGLRLELPIDRLCECIRKVGIGFLFAPQLHPAMKHVARVRRELGVRTAFNLLGPLTNPARVRRHLIGTSGAVRANLVSDVLQKLGTDKACVVAGADGMDEVTLAGPTHVIELQGNKRREYTLRAEDFGLPAGKLSDLCVQDRSRLRAEAERVLKNEAGPALDVVIANSALGLHVADLAGTIRDGVAMARETLASGKAWGKLQEWREFTNAT